MRSQTLNNTTSADMICSRYIAIGTEEGSVRVIRYNEARTVRVGKMLD